MNDLEAVCSAVTSCRECGLSDTRTRAVPGEGNPDAEIMFVGEGPGFHEDQQARPFVGPAGKFLDELLESIGMRRTDVYITNVVKCRPPGNRDPLPNEVDACRPYLLRQIELIDPGLIVTLGRFSLAWFFPRESISKVHGSLRRLGNRCFFHVYHPAAALHAGNLRKVIQDDFAKIPAALEKARTLTGENAVATAEPVGAAARPSAEQMKLF